MYGSPIGQNEGEERHRTARTEDNLSAMRDFVPLNEDEKQAIRQLLQKVASAFEGIG